MDQGVGEVDTRPLLSQDMEELPQDEDHSHTAAASVEEKWYDNPLQVMAMTSNFSTSYNVVNISLVLPILEQLHKEEHSEDAAASGSSLLAGMILGQVLGGALGDSFLGRLGALRLVMALQVIASIGSCSLERNDEGDIYLHLAAWRFVLGLGCGAVYPLAAVLSAEQGQTTNNEAEPDNDHDDSEVHEASDQVETTENTSSSDDSSDQIHRVVLTFSTQGLGFVTVPILAVVLLHLTENLDLVWRLLLGFGSVPGISLLLLQWYDYRRSRLYGTTIPTTEEEEEEVGENPSDDHAVTTETTTTTSDDVEVPSSTRQQGQEESDGILVGSIDEQQQEEENHGIWDSIRHEPELGRKLLGTAGTWFLFDVLFYGNTLFQPLVTEAAFGGSSSEDAIELLQKTAQDSLILNSLSLPGYMIAGWVLGKRTLCLTQTPRYVMLQGFFFMGILYMAIGANWNYLRGYPLLLVFLYGMTFFFANYGPNTTTFILPSLVYSHDCRSTLNGISAASGKLGALVGATFFEPVADDLGDDRVMMICSVIAVLACALTYLFVPKSQAGFAS